VDAPGSVSIASDERWELAAVVGGTQSAQHLAEELALGGVEAMLAPLVPSSVGAATVTWTQGGQG
jgi:hypothetical protein